MTKEKAIEVMRKYECCAENHQADNIAIEAIMMRIPKKPAVADDRYSDTQIFHRCPFCLFLFGVQLKGQRIRFEQPKYCPDCGQAIDWGVKE